MFYALIFSDLDCQKNIVDSNGHLMNHLRLTDLRVTC
jgi:hypothetical protein